MYKMDGLLRLCCDTAKKIWSDGIQGESRSAAEAAVHA